MGPAFSGGDDGRRRRRRRLGVTSNIEKDDESLGNGDERDIPVSTVAPE